MMRETEAEKEASAIKIKAESDRHVAQVFADAARTLAVAPGAMTLRVLQTISDVSNSKSTVIVPIPIELLGTLGMNRPSVSGEPASGAGAESFPLAVLEMKSGKARAVCPGCGTRYSMTAEVLGNMKYDFRRDIPGQQIKCKRCEAVFTLPEIK